jgi:hypothetical protein
MFNGYAQMETNIPVIKCLPPNFVVCTYTTTVMDISTMSKLIDWQ